jgi:Zn-finger nucleic acid-binding protein
MAVGTRPYMCPGCSGTLSVSPVEGLRQYVCASCEGSVITIPALRQLASSFAMQIWNEGPSAPGDWRGHCPFCAQEMQPKAVATGQAALCRPCEAVWLDKDAVRAVHVKAPAPDDQPTLGSETLRCPQCGAPVSNSWDETCQYCGAGLHAPVKVVVVPEEVPGDWRYGNRSGTGSLVGDVLGEVFRGWR